MKEDVKRGVNNPHHRFPKTNNSKITKNLVEQMLFKLILTMYSSKNLSIQWNWKANKLETSRILF